MEKVVYKHLGKASRAIRVGPGRGFDNGVVAVGHGRVMILTTDPISAIPALGMRLSAWLSVHLIASDYTTSGADPALAMFSYNFPEAMNQTEREEYVREIGNECRNLGVFVAGGHTGSYPGAGFTVIGTGSMLGFASERGYVSPSMSRVGDSIVMTKHAAIEAAASLAWSFPEFTEAKVGGRHARTARGLTKVCSTVADARAARKVGLGRGGVSSMHDATEGGVLGALCEMADAASKQFEVNPGSIPVPTAVKEVCSAFRLDPLATMGEGALLITCSPSRVLQLLETLGRSGVVATEIGEVKKGQGLLLAGRDGRANPYVPGPDEYWGAYDRAVRLRLK
jgi:hydrogenase maturation factor